MTFELDQNLAEELATYLVDPANALTCSAFPNGRTAADHAGLYSWWCDDDGLDVLSEPFGVRLPPLIYGGQTGATSTRSATERSATLRSRIGGNHLGGNVGSSTFRKTLTAILLEPLGLLRVKPGRLELGSNKRLTTWMHEHLRVAIVAVDDRVALAHLETAVLEQLDPPLNLMGMQPTPTRATLKRLRAELGQPVVET